MTTDEMFARARTMLEPYRARVHNIDRVNRAAGRAERIITRHAARRGEPLPTLYVSECGRWLTTWPGQRIAVLQTTGKAPAFGCMLTCYSATIEGRRYHGRGHGPGMYLNLRPGKWVTQ